MGLILGKRRDRFPVEGNLLGRDSAQLPDSTKLHFPWDYRGVILGGTSWHFPEMHLPSTVSGRLCELWNCPRKFPGFDFFTAYEGIQLVSPVRAPPALIFLNISIEIGGKCAF